MINNILPILIVFIISSCGDSNNGEIKDGWHKAYIEIMNAYNGRETDSTAHVFMEKGTVKKICFESDRCIEKFSMWEKYKDGQVVYGGGNDDDSLVYTIFIIPKVLTPIDDYSDSEQ